VYLYSMDVLVQSGAMNGLNLTAGPLALFALVASITPGPNNLLLMRSGAAFGIRRSVWHLAGVQIGFAGLVLLSHVGIGAMLLAIPGLFPLLRWACFGYLLWLAWIILRDTRPAGGDAAKASHAARPMSCVEAILFQLINPKAWMMAITVATAFYGEHIPHALDLATAIAVCLPIGATCMLIWTLWGASIDHVLKQPRARQLYRYGMATAVALTALWMLR
jgi:threonine/homoserine/homoserine lactone efflux protein